MYVAEPARFLDPVILEWESAEKIESLVGEIMTDEPPYPYPTMESDGYALKLVSEEKNEYALALVPTEVERFSIASGDLVKLCFLYDKPLPSPEGFGSERMWVIAGTQFETHWVGTLDNSPRLTGSLKSGDPVNFHPNHIFQIERDAENRQDPN